ncbi:MAG: DUF5670 family protein [Smithella sp.]|nr:hypothetical protein [Syntrophaceae bacterium]
MLWTIIVLLSTFWCIGLIIDHTLGSFIHILIAAVIFLLLIIIRREVIIHDGLVKSREINNSQTTS